MFSTSYLKKISDDFGLWQHVIDGQISLKDGYSLDDNARALIVSHMLDDSELVSVYFEYIKRSFDENRGNFVEFYDDKRQPIDKPVEHSSQDTQSLTRWTLAYCIKNQVHVESALELLAKTKPFDYRNNKSTRPLAYEILFAIEMLDKLYAEDLVTELISRFDKETKWFEKKLTYANGLLIYALAKYYTTFQIESVALKEKIVQSMDMLNRVSKIGDIPAPHGNREWFTFGGNTRDVYGQQPVDAGFMVLSLSEVYSLTKDEKYKLEATKWFDWFNGNNIFKQSMVQDNACSDGIDENGPSKNCGAESAILYLWAAIEFDKLHKKI